MAEPLHAQGSPDADSLLCYYKRRVAAADGERQELLERVQACAGPSAAEVYKLQAENRKRTDEVRELQKALSDAHTFLFEERERLLALQADNDSLRLQEVEDRARIKQLLSLTRPVEQTVVYGSENGPHSNAVFPRGRSASKSPRRSGGSGRDSSAARREASMPPAAAPPADRILRTVYLPNAQSEALSLKCEALQAQLAEQKRFAAERIAALQEDREIRERDAASVAAALSATAEELSEKLRGAEEALRRTTRDYILARQQRDAAEGALAAAQAAASTEREAAQAALECAEATAAAQLQQQRRELEAESRAEIAALQEQLEQRGDELLKFETVHKLLRSQLEARATDAERRAARATARCRELQQRRACEMEGWAADVGQLRKRIAGVERRLTQMRLVQRLPDDERRDALLAKHARLAPGGPQHFEYEASLDELVEELLCIKDSLLGVADRHARAAVAEAAVLQGSRQQRQEAPPEWAATEGSSQDGE